MATKTETVVTQLGAAFAESPERGQAAMAELFAEKVDLRHTPPVESDGVIDGALLATVSQAEIAALRRAMPDLIQEDVRLAADGDDVFFTALVRGTLASGKSIAARTDVVLTVADGQIVGMEARLDPETMAQWGEALTAGGFELPAEFAGNQGRD